MTLLIQRGRHWQSLVLLHRRRPRLLDNLLACRSVPLLAWCLRLAAQSIRPTQMRRKKKKRRVTFDEVADEAARQRRAKDPKSAVAGPGATIGVCSSPGNDNATAPSAAAMAPLAAEASAAATAPASTEASAASKSPALAENPTAPQRKRIRAKSLAEASDSQPVESAQPAELRATTTPQKAGSKQSQPAEITPEKMTPMTAQDLTKTLQAFGCPTKMAAEISTMALTKAGSVFASSGAGSSSSSSSAAWICQSLARRVAVDSETLDPDHDLLPCI